jgi:hypothetical protein
MESEGVFPCSQILNTEKAFQEMQISIRFVEFWVQWNMSTLSVAPVSTLLHSSRQNGRRTVEMILTANFLVPL